VKEETMRYEATLSTAARQRESALPDDLWVQCPYCKQNSYKQTLGDLKVCPHCHYGFRLTAHERQALLTDDFTEWDAEVETHDPLHFPGYTDKIAALQLATEQKESVLTGVAAIGGSKTALAIMDAHFLMGSLGSATGEKITRLFERATQYQLPVVLFAASGGARMQEGIHSLMQMAKVSQAVAQHSAAGLLYVVVLTDPTMGGVTASFAMQGDITLAEPHSLIGFAGKRVIEQTINQKLPNGFQRTESVMQSGFIDQIVPRSDLPSRLASLLRLHMGGQS